MIVSTTKQQHTTKEEERKMMTKEQERKALEQIKKVLAGLEKDGYVASAFDGCVEMAEENIECDYCLSMTASVDNWAKKATKANEELENAKRTFAEKELKLLAEVESMRDEALEIEEELEKELESTKRLKSEVESKLEDAEKRAEQVEADLAAERQKSAELENEVIRLKAKLYDLLVK